MPNVQNNTKICKHCGMVIPYNAKICPHCRRKLKGGKLKWILLAILLLMLIGSFGKGSSEKKEGKVGSVENGQITMTESTTEGASVKEGTGDLEKAEDTDTAGEQESVSESTAEENIQTVYHVGDVLQEDNLQIIYMSSGEYSEDIDDTLDTLFKEVSTLGIRQKQATLDKLERWTVKSQKYAQYIRSHSSFNVLENYIDFEKSCRELEITIYNYIYNLIVRHGGLVYYGKLINHYPDQDFISLHDRDCNSLFYNLCIKYLGRNDEYILNAIAYILEK